MVGIIFDDIFLEHRASVSHHGLDHPERPERLIAIKEMLEKERLFKSLLKIPIREATLDELKLNHTEEYIKLVSETEKIEFSSFDADTYTCKNSFRVAKFAVGGLLNLLDYVMDKKIDSGFAFIRPPGHHAEKNQAMGFCIFNNIAIAAHYLIKNHKLNRVIILDFDVHHGNGTQNSFYNTKEVFYISLHQFPHYPGTGAPMEIGEGLGRNYNLNIPMNAGFGDKEYINAFKNIIEPRVSEYKPEFILVSAGFDAHVDDPLSGINLTESGYKKIAEYMNRWAKEYSDGKIVYALEGGYKLDALASSVKEVLTAMV